MAMNEALSGRLSSYRLRMNSIVVLFPEPLVPKKDTMSMFSEKKLSGIELLDTKNEWFLFLTLN